MQVPHNMLDSMSTIQYSVCFSDLLTFIYSRHPDIRAFSEEFDSIKNIAKIEPLSNFKTKSQDIWNKQKNWRKG